MIGVCWKSVLGSVSLVFLNSEFCRKTVQYYGKGYGRRLNLFFFLQNRNHQCIWNFLKSIIILSFTLYYFYSHPSFFSSMFVLYLPTTTTNLSNVMFRPEIQPINTINYLFKSLGASKTIWNKFKSLAISITHFR